MHRHRYRTRSGEERQVWREKLKIGGRLRYVTAPTRGDLRLRILKAHATEAKGKAARSGDVPIPDLLRAWLEAERATGNPLSVKRYASLVAAVCPLFAGVTAAELRPSGVDKALAKLAKRMARSSVKMARTILGRSLRPLLRDGALTMDAVALSAPIASADPRPPTTWTPAQGLYWLEHMRKAEDPEEALYTLLLVHGLRESEALNCRLDGLSLPAGWLEYTPLKKKRPKPRRLGLVQHSAEAVQRWLLIRRQLPMLSGIRWQDRGFLFCNQFGGRKCPRALLRRFHRIRQQIGLPYIRPHDLRHSHATIALERNVSARVVQEALAHSSYGITMDTYTHVGPEMVRGSATEVEKALWGQPEGQPLPEVPEK